MRSQLTEAPWTERARAVIPGGTSTKSKTPSLMPEEPGVIVRGKGGRVWDDQGREFIDFRNALGPVTLGYAHPAVDEAIRRQLGDGIIFGHPHPLECLVAERICDLIPSADQVQFLKTGGEALAAVIRMARAYTGRDHVIQIGYNGWLNSLASGARVLPGTIVDTVPGVPATLSALHHTVEWGDTDTLATLFAEFSGEVALLLVAADYAGLQDAESFYLRLRQLTAESGTLLAFDEIVTGFRVAVGGVQERFGVTPDLSVFGKGMANGMPISAFCGRADILHSVASGEVVISSTFGGETLSLAAALATMDVFATEDVVGHLARQGDRLWTDVRGLLETHGIPVSVLGLGVCPELRAHPDAPANALPDFFRAAYRHGVSLARVSFVSFGHTNDDVDETLERLEAACLELTHQAS